MVTSGEFSQFFGGWQADCRFPGGKTQRLSVLVKAAFAADFARDNRLREPGHAGLMVAAR
jgi:hypothetical protein